MKPEVVTRRIEAFHQRFGEPHLDFAYHAAFPLALTPDLLYRLWANFQYHINREALKIPWLAVADLLLSSLCDEVGYELYEMETEVRNALLRQLKVNPRFGEKRIHELSDFLLVYVKQQLESHDPDMRDFAQVQTWTALAYTKPGEAAREIASALAKLKLEEKAEWVRMASIVETFAEPLAGFEPLLIYSRGMASFVRGKTTKAVTELSQLAKAGDKLEVSGLNLSIAESLIRQIKENSQSTQNFGDRLGFDPVPEELNDSDIEILTELLIRTFRAEYSARKVLCIRIGIEPNQLGFLRQSTDADFALELINYLHTTDDKQALWKICKELEVVFKRGKYAADLENIKSKLKTHLPIKILFLAAEPSDEARLRLLQELRDIRERLQLSKERDRFILESRESVRVADITQAILDVDPQIVHLSGHETNTGELMMENLTGKPQLVQADALAALFKLVADKIDCVVLNACYSEIQAQAIAQHINYVIGINQAIRAEGAIVFTVGFYKALVANRSIEEAYQFGCAEIQLYGLPEHLKPVIYKKNIPVQQVISKPADKRTDLTPGQRRRISQELESLQKQYDLFSDILKRLRRDLAIMPSTGVLFLEQQIEQTEAEIEQLAQKIENLENKLQ